MIIIDKIKPKLLNSSVITIGAFDGVHLGHRKICSILISKSQHHNVPSVVVIFDPHPKEFFKRKISKITTLDQQIEKIKKQNIDYLVILKFNKELSQVTATDFINNWVIKPFNPKCIVVGHDFTFGHNRMGNTTLLKKIKSNFEVTTVNPIKFEEQIVSSTLIRDKIKTDIELANKLLHDPYSIIGVVIKGDGRGKSLGFPTMNIKISSELIPKKGVYLTKTYIENKKYNSVTNIGFRPTFNNNKTKLHIESHLLNFDKNVYDKKIVTEFNRYLRDEKRFKSTDELINQIKKDVQSLKNYQ